MNRLISIKNNKIDLISIVGTINGLPINIKKNSRLI